MRTTSLLRAYGALARVALPLVKRSEIRKLSDHGTPKARWQEKLGFASVARPDGPVIWFHAASVGESLSVLGLIETMGTALPETHFLLTSGTPTSADLIASRLPLRCQHQFAPLDAPQAVARFLKHWTPDALVFVESELWPNMIQQCVFADIPVALINARMSDKSLAGWKKRPKSATCLLSQFSLIETQTDDLADALCALGADPETTQRGPNLKAHSAPLPKDDALMGQLQAALGDRPVWVAASTHPGEEEVVLSAHKTLREQHPDLCLILAPRHPGRAAEVATRVQSEGLEVSRRSESGLPVGPVYLLDTMGELGSVYPLSQFVFLGGSFAKMGGHNPYEVVQNGVPVLTGPDIRNFSDVFGQLVGDGSARIVPAPERLADYAVQWLASPEMLAQARAATAMVGHGQSDALDALSDRLIGALRLEGNRAS